MKKENDFLKRYKDILREIPMRATIIRFEGPYAIRMKENSTIIDVKRINITVEAEEGDILT